VELDNAKISWKHKISSSPYLLQGVNRTATASEIRRAENEYKHLLHHKIGYHMWFNHLFSKDSFIKNCYRILQLLAIYL